jgi:hypothetical protein
MFDPVPGAGAHRGTGHAPAYVAPADSRIGRMVPRQQAERIVNAGP